MDKRAAAQAVHADTGRTASLIIRFSASYRITLLGALLALAACRSGAFNTTVQDALPLSSRTQAPGASARTSLSLYVCNDAYPSFTVTVYASDGTAPRRTISQGISGPAALVFDASRNLYVANEANSTVTVYAPGSTSVLRTISQAVSSPTALAFDSSGNLYVANYGSSTVSVYAPGSTSVLRTITQGISEPIALAFGPSGNLFVGNVTGDSGPHGTVTAYAPGSGNVLRTLPQNSLPKALSFDRAGKLYVANRTYVPNGFGSYVAVYSAGGKKWLYTLYAVSPVDLKFDGSGYLYVANFGGPGENFKPGKITVFAPGGTKVLRTIYNGVVSPEALEFNGTTLFVANFGASTVTVYARGENLARTISKGIGRPLCLAFGP